MWTEETIGERSETRKGKERRANRKEEREWEEEKRWKRIEVRREERGIKEDFPD